MKTAAFTCAIILLLAVAGLIANTGLMRKKRRMRRHHRTAALPFLFFPTTDHNHARPPEPAWNGAAITPAQISAAIDNVLPAAPVRPEPGIADMPPDAEPPDMVEIPAGYRTPPQGRHSPRAAGSPELRNDRRVDRER
jgi:hypothetical protein